MENTGNDGDTMKEDDKVDNGVIAERVASKNEDSVTSEWVEDTPVSTICQFFLVGRCRFGDKCRNTHKGEAAASSHPHVTKDKGKGDQTSKPKGKKPPMKTAEDVISRIQWDSHLPKEHFIVGYLDRFLGTIEKPFSAFCWEDLSSVGVDVLAIPQHRIQYFKYRDMVVWDKANRVDNIFGSTGSGLTILDIIHQYETLAQTEENNLEEDNRQGQGDATTDNDEEEEAEEKDCNSLHQEHNKKSRPKHFIAVRISDEDVRHSVKEVQNVLLKHNPDMSEYCIASRSLNWNDHLKIIIVLEKALYCNPNSSSSHFSVFNTARTALRTDSVHTAF
ncbi:uncharacterized protein [Dendropsophus ebraccatus]|uniref:uncharacterized protein n=1 Tax=Dendropsophus ebraccatus TaxID=150705 RepID=UPI00383168B7